MQRCAALAAVAMLGSCTTPATRLAMLEQTLAANPSATAALTQWCARRRLADPPRITAQPVMGEVVAADASVRALLEVTGTEPVAFRNVRLVCGDKVLSRARNWYVPARLTPDMNRQLAASDTPFGTVAAPLAFTRERLAQQRGSSSQCPHGTALSHSAVLRLPNGQPISLVVECYTTEAVG
jgi:chorismate-pyruvate lyase